MANYSFVVGSKFQPLTYQELLAPVQASTEAHIKKRDELGLYQATAEALKERALAEPDQNWSKKYMDYLDNLEDASKALATQGLSPDVENKALKARNGYFSAVVPAQTALARLQQLSDIQFKQNPELRMAYGALPTIDTLIATPEYTPAAYSGKEVYEQALKSGATATTKNVVDKFVRSRDFPAFIKHINTVGYSEKDADSLMKNHPEMKNLIDTVVKQHQDFEGLDEVGKNKMKTEIVKGLFDASIYSSKNSLIQNPEYMENLRAKHEREKAEKPNVPPRMDFNTVILKTGNLDFDKHVSDFIDKKNVEFSSMESHFNTLGKVNESMVNSVNNAEANKIFDEQINTTGGAGRFRDKYPGETDAEYKEARDKAEEVASTNRQALKSIMKKIDPAWVRKNMPQGMGAKISRQAYEEAMSKIKSYQTTLIDGTNGMNVHDVYAFYEFKFPITNAETQKAVMDLFKTQILYKAKFEGKKGEPGRWVKDESDKKGLQFGYENKSIFGKSGNYEDPRVLSIDFSPSAGLTTTIEYGKADDRKVEKYMMPPIDINTSRNLKGNIQPQYAVIYDAYRDLNKQNPNPDKMKAALYNILRDKSVYSMTNDELNAYAASYYKFLIDKTRNEMNGFFAGNKLESNEIKSTTR